MNARLTHLIAIVFLLSIFVTGCVKKQSGNDEGAPEYIAGDFHPERWPLLERAMPQDNYPFAEKQAKALLSQMSLRQKIGQIIQVDARYIEPQDLTLYPVGSIITRDLPILQDGLSLADDVYDSALMAELGGGPFIPPLMAIDLSRSDAGVKASTVFPRNIGLGATRNPALIKDIGSAIETQMRQAGYDWIIANTLSLTSDSRAVYARDGFGADPKLSGQSAAALLGGMMLSGQAATNPTAMLVGGKHILGSGNDEGDLGGTEADLKDAYLPLLRGAMAQNPHAVMVSAQSWSGTSLIGSRELMHGIMRSRLGYDGVLVGDVDAHAGVSGCSASDCVAALHAGLDIYGAGEDWRVLFDSLLSHAKAQELDGARLDEAVGRILRMKLNAGIFGVGKPAHRRSVAKADIEAHAELAKAAVRQSIVLLKNEDGVLPLSPLDKILISEVSAFAGFEDAKKIRAEAIFQRAVSEAVEASGGKVLTWDGEHRFKTKPDIAIFVLTEELSRPQSPLANLALSKRVQAELDRIKTLRAVDIPIITILMSDRALYASEFIEASDAFVAAWRPGSRADAIAEVLFVAPTGLIQHDFTGRLPTPWPRHVNQYIVRGEGMEDDPLYPMGYGLTYR